MLASVGQPERRRVGIGRLAFNSLTFILFFGLVVVVHNLPLSWRARKLNLVLASYLFYAAWNPPFVVLLWISTLVDWTAARRLTVAPTPGRRRFWLGLSLTVNLGLLAAFKYGSFLLANFVWLAARAGVEYQPADLDIVLPVGLSFYTFQTLSYTLDVWRGRMRPWSSLLDFALFVTFFPQLVAGPIVRARDFLGQCVEPRRVDTDRFGWGLTMLAIGLFEKVVLADGIFAPVVDRVFPQAPSVQPWQAWTGALAFSGQIFCDFGGYSLCALGVALCLGFDLPDNFRAPFAAVGLRYFWRRWHISLSSWLRDYLYITLGGNRAGVWKTYTNLFVTMLLGGLWHGASWTFVAWGGLHGVGLAVERRLGQCRWAARPGSMTLRLLATLATFTFVSAGFVLFRAPDFETARAIFSAMAGAGGRGIDWARAEPGLALGALGGLLATHWRLRETTLEELWAGFPAPLRPLLLSILFLATLLSTSDDRAFIYFQF